MNGGAAQGTGRSPLPAEFLLVAECCRWPRPTDDSLDARWTAERIDWPRVARIARRHRVEALVWNRLRSAQFSVPGESAGQLAAAAARTARDNLHAARECARLKASFEAAAVPILFIKGVTLAMLAYGTLSLKAGWDIDLLVDEHQLDGSATILESAGYSCIHPPAPGRDGLRRWHCTFKESVWRHRARNHVVELHTRLVDNVMLLPEVGLQRRQMVVLPGGAELPTLAAEELFAYLCVHGGSSAWFRLKWLADLCALIAPLRPAELGRLYRGALKLGAGRAAAVALILGARLLGVPIAAPMRRELERDFVTRAMARVGLHMMTGRYLEAEVHSRPFGTVPIHLMQPFLLPGSRFLLSEARRQFALSLGGVRA
jgi:hypothetical protein